jgi:Sigma-70, region 4
MLDMAAIAAHWGELPGREQQILLLRFRGDMTQVQIGQQLGISQMHVSRLHALGYLRPRLLGLPQREPGTARTAAADPDLTTAAASRRRAPGASPASLPAVPRTGSRQAAGTR